jgi:hypothetical protein
VKECLSDVFGIKLSAAVRKAASHLDQATLMSSQLLRTKSTKEAFRRQVQNFPLNNYKLFAWWIVLVVDAILSQKIWLYGPSVRRWNHHQ